MQYGDERNIILVYTIPMYSISLSVFLPTFNEEKNIEKTVTHIYNFLKGHPRIAQFEIIVINDGSTDGTEKVVEGLRKSFPELVLVNHEVNKGYGGALRSGFTTARHDFIFFTDADGQFNIHNLDTFLSYIREYDAVVGYRAQRQDSLKRKINTALWNTLIRFLFDLRIRDIDCAFKLIRKTTVSDLLITSNGAMASTEILVHLTRNHRRIHELPVEHLPRLHGSPTGARIDVIMKAFKDLYRIYRHEKSPR